MALRTRGVLDYIVENIDVVAQMSTIVVSSFFRGASALFVTSLRFN